MKLFAIFFIFLFLIGIHGFYSDRMCGAKLSQMMWIVCENGFNSMMNKRSGPSSSVVPAIGSDLPYPYSSNALSEIFQIENANLLAKTRRTRMMGGIVDECCKKSCTIGELAAYCLP